MQTGTKVKLLAGDQVILRRGFVAKGDFEARTEPCNNVIIKSAKRFFYCFSNIFELPL